MALKHVAIGSADVTIFVDDILDLAPFDSLTAVCRRFEGAWPIFQGHQQTLVHISIVPIAKTFIECVGVRDVKLGGIDHGWIGN